MRAAFLVALVLVACGIQTPAPDTTPVASSSPVVVYPPAGCAAMCANLQARKCRWYTDTCVGDCEHANATLIAEGQPSLNLGCVTASVTCERALLCRDVP